MVNRSPNFGTLNIGLKDITLFIYWNAGSTPEFYWNVSLFNRFMRGFTMTVYYLMNFHNSQLSLEIPWGLWEFILSHYNFRFCKFQLLGTQVPTLIFFLLQHFKTQDQICIKCERMMQNKKLLKFAYFNNKRYETEPMKKYKHFEKFTKNNRKI